MDRPDMGKCSNHFFFTVTSYTQVALPALSASVVYPLIRGNLSLRNSRRHIALGYGTSFVQSY